MHQQDLHFNQFEEKTNTRIRYKRVSEKTGKEVPYEDITKGYEVTKGHYVIPIYYENTYYLAPDGGEGAARAYALLRAAMENQEKVGIGRVVMRTKQYLAAVRPLEARSPFPPCCSTTRWFRSRTSMVSPPGA